MNKKPVPESGWSSVRCVSTINVPGNGLVPPPGAGGVVHVAADDPAAQPLGERLVVFPVRAMHTVGVAAIIGIRPRAAHHPVVETLALDAEAVLRPSCGPTM